jgi:hypothetical protein
MARFKWILLLVINLVLLGAVLWPLLGNASMKDWELQLYTGKISNLHRSLVLLAAGLAGAVLVFIWRRTLPATWRAWRAAAAVSRQRAAKQAQQALQSPPPPRSM